MQNERLTLKLHPVHINIYLVNARDYLKNAIEKCGGAKSVTDYIDTALEATNEAIKRIDELNKSC